MYRAVLSSFIFFIKDASRTVWAESPVEKQHQKTRLQIKLRSIELFFGYAVCTIIEIRSGKINSNPIRISPEKYQNGMLAVVFIF